MTNERLEYFCRNVDVNNAKLAIPDEVAIVDFYDLKINSTYDDFIVLFNNGVRVGAVFPMGNVDLHMGGCVKLSF